MNKLLPTPEEVAKVKEIIKRHATAGLLTEHDKELLLRTADEWAKYGNHNWYCSRLLHKEPLE